jgi:MFS family permease
MQLVNDYWLRTFGSLHIRNFRLYFFSQAVSLSGNWVQLIAQSWLVLQLSNSGALLGIITGLQFLPSLFLGPWIGTIIDRVSKRRLLYITNVVAALCSLVLGLLVVTGHIEIWMVGVLGLISGLANAFEMPARQTFVADLVDKGHLQNAITLGALEANFARIIGPALGAVCIAFVSIGGCFLINAASYICALIGLFLMHRKFNWDQDRVPRARGQMMEGLQYIRDHQMPRVILGMMILIGTLVCEFFITLPLLAKITFGGGAETYAAMTTASGIGAVLGGLYIAGGKIPRNLGVLAWRAVALGVCMLLLAAAPTYATALAVLVVLGAAQLMLVASANAMLMAHVDVHMRGRMNAWWVVIFTGSTPLGGPLMGWIAQHGSPALAFTIGGFAAILSGGVVLLRKSTRTVETPERAEEVTA